MLRLPPGGAAARVHVAEVAASQREEPEAPQRPGRARSVRAVPIRATVRCGRKEGSPPGALAAARRH